MIRRFIPALLTVLYTFSVNSAQAADAALASGKSTRFPSPLLRPGVTFGNEQKWFLEIPFGLIQDEFAILATIGMHL